MEVGLLIPALALSTLLIVLIAAFVSKRETEAEHKDPRAPKSALATDGPKPDERA
jgi:hypothetical protein